MFGSLTVVKKYLYEEYFKQIITIEPFYPEKCAHVFLVILSVDQVWFMDFRLFLA